MEIFFSVYQFCEPLPAASWEPPYCAGIYASLVRDSAYKPKPYRLIYVGESGNMSQRGFWRSHHKYDSWIAEAGSEDELYIATYLMPDVTPEGRREVESAIVTKYKPCCNN